MFRPRRGLITVSIQRARALKRQSDIATNPMPKLTQKTVQAQMSLEPDVRYHKLTQKTRFRIAQIARMTLDGMRDDEIAIHLGYRNYQTVANIKFTPEYKLILNGLTSKYTTELDLEAASKVKELKEEIRCRIPEALRVYYDALKDNKLDNRMKAAEKIIELDGRLGKKAESSTVNQFVFNDSDVNIGDSIVASLRQSAGKPPIKSLDQLEDTADSA